MRRGFTLVEMMVVIVIIAILAAISYVTYNGLQARAYDSAVQSDLDAAAGLVEEFRTNLSDARQFPRGKADLEQLTIKASKSSYDTTATVNFVFCVNTSDNYQSYALLALSKSGKTFMETQDGAKTTTVTKSDFGNAVNLCHTINANMGVASSGMYAPGSWQTWVHDA